MTNYTTQITQWTTQENENNVANFHQPLTVIEQTTNLKLTHTTTDQNSYRDWETDRKSVV